jgi:hypothetical protein
VQGLQKHLGGRKKNMSNNNCKFMTNKLRVLKRNLGGVGHLYTCY